MVVVTVSFGRHFLKELTLKFLLKTSDRLLEIDVVNKMESCYPLSSITLD